jgi:hypothetical protein
MSNCPNVQNGIQTIETKGAGVSDNVSDNTFLSEALSESVCNFKSINSDRFGQSDSKRACRWQT